MDKLTVPLDAPHAACINSENSFRWVMDNLDDLRPNLIGQVILWGSNWLYTSGSTPSDFGYVYMQPERIAHLKAELRVRGIPVIGYWSPARWCAAGLGAFHAQENIEALDLDGVMIDDGPVKDPTQMWITFTLRADAMYSFFRWCKRKGFIVWHHASVEPWFGRIDWRPVWNEVVDFTMYGETNPVPATDREWRVLDQMAGGVCYKPPSFGPHEADGDRLRANPLLWIEPVIKLLGRRAIYRVFGQDRRQWATYVNDFLPRWKAAR